MQSILSTLFAILIFFVLVGIFESFSLTYSFKYFITFGYTYFKYRISIPLSCPFYFNACIFRCLYPRPFLMSISCHLFWNFDWITVDPYIILSCFLNFLPYTFVSIPVYTSFIIENNNARCVTGIVSRKIFYSQPFPAITRIIMRRH